MTYPPQGSAAIPEPGPKGDKGDRGDKGDLVKGDKGDKGERGESIKGDKGESIKGEKGDRGEVLNLMPLIEEINQFSVPQDKVIQSLEIIAKNLVDLNNRLEGEHITQEKQRTLERKALDALNRYLEKAGEG